ncbi:MAG: hypothetical protein RL653_864 [Pseudomonadota bacterium]|jgi:formylglycine-generating enzyme required for sulfatase activity
MSTRFVVAVFGLLSLAASAQRAGALDGKKIAVLEFSLDSGTQLRAPGVLSDDCRGAVADVTRAEGAIVITRENMLEVLKATGGKCQEGECEVETARNLGVDLFVTGNVTALDGQLVLSLKVYETRKGQLLGQKRVIAAKELALLELIRPTTEELLRTAFGLGNARPAATKAQPTVQLGSFGDSGKDVVVQEGEEVVVKFESEPAGATVSVDGELLCQSTPCSKRIASGRHEVLFQKERYSASRLNGIATKGAVVRGTLAPRFGWLTIETDVPGLSVSVDGADIGKTPISAREVDEGTVEVAVSDGCYVRTGERIAIKPGERRTLRLVAKPKLAGLKVNAVDEKGNDLETTVRVDGKEVGEAGATLKVPVCSREVAVHVGSGEWREELKLEDGKVTVLTANPGRGKSAGMVAIAGSVRMLPFKLDVTEVTVAAYFECVNTGKCTEPNTGEQCNWKVSGKEQHPINCVDWMQADAYCKAQGKRLPGWNEWHFAASNGGRTRYPWGGQRPDATRAKWKSSDGTAPVGTYTLGASLNGIHDLSGNVWEWTAESGEIRGGSWGDEVEEYLLSSFRSGINATVRNDLIGFRCAQ